MLRSEDLSVVIEFIKLYKDKKRFVCVVLELKEKEKATQAILLNEALTTLRSISIAKE